MTETAGLISSIASLLWPLFAFTVLGMFKKEIGDLVGRIKRGKLLGQEIELSESLNRLEESAVAVAKEVAALPVPQSNSMEAEQKSLDEDQIKNVLQEAVRSPRAALILLASDIEKETRQLLASVGHLKGQQYVPLPHAIDVLSKQFGGLPGHIPTSLKFFWDARNRLVHGKEADSEEILRAIDSGITILKALQAFPRETNVVYHPGVTVYRDSLCRNSWPNVRGVILETESPGKTKKFFRIFPTTKNHFQKDKRVAWEWSSEQSWGEAWYKDPDTGEIKLAWSSAMEFVGRHLEDV
jgi:hypothetical protein